MTEGEYNPDRVRAEPNAAPVRMFVATGLTFIIISERRIDPSLLDIIFNDPQNDPNGIGGVYDQWMKLQKVMRQS
jgi:hypothetical protein